MSLKHSIPQQRPMNISLALWLPFFFCHYWTCLCLNVSLVSGHSVHCLEDQKLLLLQLKKALKFNPSDSRKLLFWNESSPCGEWRGVRWDAEGHVAGLDLSEELISGGLENSSTLFSLPYLKHLNLAFNDFNSMIPSRIKLLKSLTFLNLSNAGFVGQIPMEIAQLTRLAILDLSTRYYFEESYLKYFEESALKLEIPNLVKLVQNLSEVRELYVDGINIALKGNEWGLALSSSLPHLQVLSMSNCNISGPIDSSLKILQNLSVIRLHHNPLSAPVPDFFAKFSNLTQLDLSFCNLRGRFPNKIFQVQSLTSLDLSQNDGLQGSLPDFPEIGSLQTLTLSYTNFSGALPDSISNLRHMSTLDISTCQFYGTLPDSMSNFTELAYLDLSFNSFTGPIPPFGMARKLTRIYLSNNKLSGGILSAHFKGLDKLVLIDFWNNSLNGSVPMSLFSLPLLQYIFLSNNRFQEFDVISNVSSSILRSLDLSSNSLQGLIPQFIFHLRGLETLMLSSNKFDGTIRLDMFWRLGNLTQLDLSNNNLSIDVNGKNAHPSSFPNMLYLSLASCNHIEGPMLEKIIMDFRALYDLNLSNNNLSGHIPSSIWKLQQLEYLDLSNNSLTGEIPAELANMPSLLFVNLSYNHLVGRIPVGVHLQLQSLDGSSFQGNEGLYGPPLTQGPNDGTQKLRPPPPTSANNHGIDYEFITGLVFGVVFGVGIIIWPLFFWKQWRIRYWNCVAFILCSIFPQIYVDYQRHGGQWFTVLRWSR